MKSSSFRFLIPVLIAAVVFESCHSSQQEQTGQSTLTDPVENSEDSLGAHYFDFDEVDHYHIEIGHVYFGADSSLGNEEKVFRQVFQDDFPAYLTDTSFVSELPGLDYEKEEIPESKNEAINELFREKGYDEYEVAACIPEYRDILIFRKTGKIIGIAKICFTCSSIFVTGTEVNYGHFGSYDGFSKLAELLYSEN